MGAPLALAGNRSGPAEELTGVYSRKEIGVHGTAMSWAIAIIAPQRDRTVAEHLSERYGIASFDPRFLTRVVRKGRHVETVRPMFPGYLFVAPGRWREVLATPGVRGFLMSEGEPAVLSSQSLHGIRSRCDRDGFCREDQAPKEVLLAIGDEVLILAGALSGFSAVYEGPGRGDKSAVAVEIFGRPTQAFVPTRHLERLQTS